MEKMRFSTNYLKDISMSDTREDIIEKASAEGLEVTDDKERNALRIGIKNSEDLAAYIIFSDDEQTKISIIDFCDADLEKIVYNDKEFTTKEFKEAYRDIMKHITFCEGRQEEVEIKNDKCEDCTANIGYEYCRYTRSTKFIFENRHEGIELGLPEDYDYFVYVKCID